MAGRARPRAGPRQDPTSTGSRRLDQPARVRGLKTADQQPWPSSGTPQERAPGRQGATVELIEVGGRKIAYRQAGGGHPLVLLHGAWSDGREWRPQLAGLPDEFDVIAWDAPGCGGSDDPPPEMGMDDYADSIADLITALVLRQVHLCGLSFGGGLALPVYPPDHDGGTARAGRRRRHRGVTGPHLPATGAQRGPRPARTSAARGSPSCRPVSRRWRRRGHVAAADSAGGSSPRAGRCRSGSARRRCPCRRGCRRCGC